jgi:prolyl 4-hydroxylase
MVGELTQGNGCRKPQKRLLRAAGTVGTGPVSELAAMSNPDQAALASTGALVRARLDGDPSVYKVPVAGAELWTRGAFLSEDECDRLAAMIDAAAEPSGILSHGYTEVWRTSSSANFDRSDPFIQQIERQIDGFVGLPGEWGETIQGQRYEPGQQFRDHLDTFWTEAEYWADEARRGGQRAATAMVFLSDVEAGGETEFARLGASVPPQKGVILAWNNVTADGSLNEMTLHAGRPVERGVKYIITKWYRTRPWGEP